LHFSHNFLSFCSLAELVKRKPVKLIGKHFPEVEIELRRKVTEGRISVFKQVAERRLKSRQARVSTVAPRRRPFCAVHRGLNSHGYHHQVAPRRKANGRISVG
jgi:hypothetical protein